MGKLDKIEAIGVQGAPHIFWHGSQVSAEVRSRQAGQRPATIWLTGLSGAGKSTLASALEGRLVGAGHMAYVLDGDNLRHHLNRDLGFSPADRQENIRRSAEVARIMNDAGLFVICAFISPLRRDREMARQIIGADNFLETHVSTSAAVCEARDPKGLYQKARAGLIPEFTGISAPYEEPLAPALKLDTGALPLDACCERLYQQLARRFI